MGEIKNRFQLGLRPTLVIYFAVSILVGWLYSWYTDFLLVIYAKNLVGIAIGILLIFFPYMVFAWALSRFTVLQTHPRWAKNVAYLSILIAFGMVLLLLYTHNELLTISPSLTTGKADTQLLLTVLWAYVGEFFAGLAVLMSNL